MLIPDENERLRKPHTLPRVPIRVKAKLGLNLDFERLKGAAFAVSVVTAVSSISVAMNYIMKPTL